MIDYKLEPGRTRTKIDYELQDDKPEITIITSYWNGDKYIDQTLNCILNQTFPYWEWIIVDDGSTKKESLEKLDEIAKVDKRIKVVHKENSGVAASRDFGANLASQSSKYLFFIDDDDLINETYLECAYWTLQTNKDASWAYSDLLNFGEKEFPWIKWFDSEIEKKENLLVATALIRKEDFFEVNGYELREKAVYEDWNLWLKLLAKNKKPVRMNFFGFWYRKKAAGSELARSKGNKERAMEIINNTGKQIKEEIEAIQYPKQDYDWEKIEEKLEYIKQYKVSNNKINILMIIPWITIGGADKFNLDLIARIDKNKFNVVVISTEPNINNWRQELEQQAIYYDLTTFLDKKYWIAFINNVIEKYNIDIILNTNSTFGYATIPYLRANYPNTPIMDYVHMEEWYNRCGGFSRDSSTVASCIDKTLVCNKNSEKVLVEYFNRNPKDIDTVYIGVDENKFDPSKFDKEEILKEFKIKPNNRYILNYICRIDIQKRPMLLVEILRKLKERRDDFLCVIAGDGPLFDKVKSKLRKYKLENNAIMLGNVKNTGKIYAISDISLNCSIKEGLALTAYESTAMGVPVISSDVGGQAELINDEVGKIVPCLQDETEILNFKYKDEEVLPYVDAIEDVINNLDKYKNNCRKRILNGFTIDQMVEKMEVQFQEVLENKKKGQNIGQLSNYKDICKELITKYYISMKDEYEWLCDQVNIEYFGESKNNSASTYNYFETPMGRFRLKVINITKKMHIYELVKKVLRKMRRSKKEK